MASRTLTVNIVGDPASFSRATRTVDRDAKRMGDRLDRTGKQVHGFATISGKGMARVGLAATGMAAAGTGAAALLAKSFVTGASDIEESLSKNRILFGRFAEDLDRFSKTSAGSFGLSRKAALEFTGTFGNLFRSMGTSRQESAKFSVGLTKLAADMASFNNTSIEEALEAIRSGLVGESEPLRRFGVNLNDAALRTEALRMGLVKTTKDALAPQAKALATQSLLFKQTSAAQGDFARTSGGLANQTRILKARLADAGAELGGHLIPFVLKAVRAINSLFDSSSKGGRALRAIAAAAKNAGKSFEGLGKSSDRTSRATRGDFSDIARASQRMANSIKSVTDQTISPAMRTIGRRVAAMASALRSIFRGIIALVNGQWSQAWTNFRIAAVKNFGGLIRALGKAAADSARLASRLGHAVVKGITDGLKGLGEAVFQGIKKGFNAAADKAASWIDKANPFSSITGNVGDGIGRKIGDGIGAGGVLPSGGAFGGSLMGARPAMRPFAAIGSQYGLKVTSGSRPGSITSSGNASWHGSGEAIDMGGSTGGMRAFASNLRSKFGGRLAELISPWANLGIKNGQPYQYSSAIQAQHSGDNAHVHVAFDSGRPGQGDGLGRFQATSYGPPWDAMNGTGVTATGVNLKNAPKRYGVAVDPSVIPLGSKLKISPNPFGYSGVFEAFDTGGAIKGKHIDFYDWRGRSKQLGWGSKFVTVSTAGGGGGSRSGGGAQGAFNRSQSGARRAAGRAMQGARNLTGAGGGGYESTLAEIDVKKAGAESSGNVKKMITALYEEAFQKRTRLRKVRRALKRRLKKATRQRLTEEEAQLIRDLKAIGELAAEYSANGMAADGSPGSAADAESGGSDGGDGVTAPTTMDWLDAELAQAESTPGSADDLAVLGKIKTERERELAEARASNDPRRVSEARRALTSVIDAMKALQDAVVTEAETRQRLIDELAGLRAEVKAQNDFNSTVTGVALREMSMALTDFISGQIVGKNLQGRRQTAGNGVIAVTP